MNITQQIITIILIAVATISTRALPFILFPSEKHTPKFVRFLGKFLASAVFGMLIVYCLKDVSFFDGNHGIPQLLGILACILLHLWKKNMLLTIAGGTAFYMAIIHIIPSCTGNDYKENYISIVQDLSSEKMHGRSNYMDGDIKAARYIIDRLRTIDGIQACGEDAKTVKQISYPPYKSPVRPYGIGRWADEDSNADYLPFLQNFCIDMNVMRGDMSASVDGIGLIPTVDFTVKEFSPSCHGTYALIGVSEEDLTFEGMADYLNSGRFKDAFAVISWQRYVEVDTNPFTRYTSNILKLDPDMIAGVVFTDSELFPYFKARSFFNSPVPVIMATESAFPQGCNSLTLHLDAEMIHNHDAHNIIAYLPGTASSNERITLIAHYDHLGLMGRDNLFPGANDNASGAAMLITLADYFSKNRPAVNLQFIWLDAEEENLLGAFYHCTNPTMPLSDISMVINLDMVADDGDRLVTEYNGTAKEGFSRMEAINNDNGSFKPFKFDIQELSDNSDHYAFASSDVPVMYFTTEGSCYQHYHTPRDTYRNSSAENFERLFSMLARYIQETTPGKN